MFSHGNQLNLVWWCISNFRVYFTEQEKWCSFRGYFKCHWWFGSSLFLQPHRELAREAVRKSLVLLKNGKTANTPLLPLDKNAQKILVVGAHANDIGLQCGGWTITWQGSPGNTTLGNSAPPHFYLCLSFCSQTKGRNCVSSWSLLLSTNKSYNLFREKTL